MLCLLNYMLMLSSMLIKVRVVHFGFRTVPHRISARLQVSYCLFTWLQLVETDKAGSHAGERVHALERQGRRCALLPVQQKPWLHHKLWAHMWTPVGGGSSIYGYR